MVLIFESGEFGYAIAVFIAGNNDVIESSKSLDLRPLDNVTRRGKVIYSVIGLLT